MFYPRLVCYGVSEWGMAPMGGKGHGRGGRGSNLDSGDWGNLETEGVFCGPSALRRKGSDTNARVLRRKGPCGTPRSRGCFRQVLAAQRRLAWDEKSQPDAATTRNFLGLSVV